MTLTELVKSIFGNPDVTQTDESGQQTVTMESILPAVEGYELIDKTVPNEPMNEPTIIEKVIADPGISREELNAVINRLYAVERLISAVDDLKSGDDEVVAKVEEW